MTTGCPKCGSVYDISAYEPGQRLRCRCGQIIVKPERDPAHHVARSFHCSACGGTLQPGRGDCPYCRSTIDMTDARLTAYCAACLGMSKAGARFCSECGKSLTAPIDSPAEAAEKCPRCAVKMRRRAVDAHRPLECPMCCGLFVAASDLDQLIREQDARTADSGRPVPRQPERASLSGEPVTYLACPVCSKLMTRLNYGRSSNVLVDWCGQHGYWLDPGELEKIAKWVASGGLKQSVEREIADLKAERARLVAGSHTSPTEDGRAGEGFVMGGILGFLAGLFEA